MHLWSLPQCCSLLFIILHYHVFCSSSEPTCHPGERYALLQFNTSNSWNTSKDCCTWYGVKCDRTTGHVTGLELRGVNSDDQISEAGVKSLAQNFPNLKRLELSEINMSSVPLVSLLNLPSSLTHLRLEYCLLNGELPDKFFTSFPKLEFLSLQNNSISGQIAKFCSTNSTINVGNLSSSCVVGSPSNLTYINVSNNSIHGPIPAWISALPYLKYLSLYDNHLSGEIGNFQTSSLERLLLGNNQLSGVIPRSIFRQTKLQKLYLSSNNLTGIVEWEELSELQELEFLHLAYNNLTLLSFNNSVKFALPKLFSVDLACCHLVEFPRFFRFGFKNGFKYLDLSNNHLKGRVPSWFLVLAKHSSFLNLSHNSLTYFDPLGQYELQVLDLQNNSFTGPLPILSSNIIIFSAAKNQFSGAIPNSFCIFNSLEVLDLSFNNLTGEIPRCIGNLSESLSVLDLRHNKLHGTISATFPKGSRLISLNLNGNQLEGMIPRSLGNCSRLELLDLGNNMLNDTFPDWLESLPSLKVLVLRANKFHGSIGNPKSISPFFNLRIMDLSRNSFTGALPSKYFESFEVMQMGVEKVQMKYMGGEYYQDSGIVASKGNNFVMVKILTIFSVIDFSRNNFSGEIPQILSTAGALDLSHNSLTGPLPILSSNIFVLLASKNQLSGPIPNSFCNFTSIFVLDLSFNNLTGEIPRCIGNLSDDLSVLDLRHNKLHGTIPATFAKGNKLRSLNLNGNQLEGMIPRSLGNCSSLEVLDLGNNMLNDTFPDWLESLPSLQVLVLRANKFHGSIGNPKSISPFFNLRIMDLSRNSFTGALPSKCFESFEAMQMGAEKVQTKYMGEEYYQDSVTMSMKGNDFVMDKILTIFSAIDFSRNNFSGEIPQSLGELVSLKGLNLSHNMLGGAIPSTFGDLKNLEWLDLCSNRLVGEIPTHLADVTSLQILNLSYNRLEGPVPHGTQFQTFPNDSFVGNLDLCGFPLSKLCREEADPSLPTLEQDEDGDDSSITNGFNWRIVMMGYASGLVIGISIGYMLLYSNGKLWWLSYRIMDEIEYIRRARRREKRRNTRGTTRRS